MSQEAALTRPLEGIWPVLEDLAGHLSRLANLPLIVFVGEHQVYASGINLMPEWCSILNNHPDLWQRCAADEYSRATCDQGRELCHAGMLVAQRKVEVPAIADITVLFGSRWDCSEEAQHQRISFLEDVRRIHPDVYEQLNRISSSMPRIVSAALTSEEIEVMDSIQRTLQVLIDATINFHMMAVNMSHEVAMVLQGTSFLLQDVVEQIEEMGKASEIADEFVDNAYIVEAENECALQSLRNFLSDSGHSRYRESKQKFSKRIRVSELIERLVQIYSRTERGKRINFVVELPYNCPIINGDLSEIERVIHNALSNAVKYSYISHNDSSERRIRCYAQIPFGNSPHKREWALCFENYGVGLIDDEQYNAFRPGFRGSEGIKQVGYGAGIGLSEIQKIMRLHQGRAKIRSRFIHAGRTGDVYLTTLKLIFPCPT